jgi:hypothetical protein
MFHGNIRCTNFALMSLPGNLKAKIIADGTCESSSTPLRKSPYETLSKALAYLYISFGIRQRSEILATLTLKRVCSNHLSLSLTCGIGLGVRIHWNGWRTQSCFGSHPFDNDAMAPHQHCRHAQNDPSDTFCQKWGRERLTRDVNA